MMNPLYTILKKKNIFLIFFLFIAFSCEKSIPITNINCQSIEDKDGIMFSENKLFTGSCNTFYEDNESLDEVRTYKDGIMSGVWAKYYRNGQLQYKGEAKRGEMHGDYVGYYFNGQLKENGRLKVGHRDGSWVLYDTNGKIIRKELHKDKQLIRYEEVN